MSSTLFQIANFSPFQSKKFVFLTISFLAVCLRFIALTRYPVSLNLDEVAIGYNAYSILKTGRDEYGTFFPIAFRSHDDYKAPLYIYLTSISIALFGMGDFAVRFTSALIGVLTVILTYYFVKETTFLKRYSGLPLLSMFFLAISPWHIQFSRAAYETNLAVFLNLFSFWAFFRGFKNPKYWVLASLTFSGSFYAYHSSKVFLPFIIIFLGIFYRQHILSHFKIATLSTILSLILIFPLILFSLSPAGQLRFKGTSVFNTPTLIDKNREQLIDQWQQGRELEAKLFHNRYLSGMMVIAKGYFSHLSYDFLFGGEFGPPQHHTPNVGLLYVWELPLLFIGFYALFRYRLKLRWLLLVWFFSAPLAASLTWDIPSSTRTEIMLPVIQIITAFGFLTLIQAISKNLRPSVIATGILIITFFFANFLHNYFRIAPLLYADAWNYGYKQAVLFCKSKQNSFDQIVVSTNLRQPQNFWAYYLQYDPQTYIEKDGGTISGGFLEASNHFDKFFFKPINWHSLTPHTLYIDLADKYSLSQPPSFTIHYPSGAPAVIIYANE